MTNSNSEPQSVVTGDSFARVLHDQRKQARQILKEQRERIARIESQLLAQIQSSLDELEYQRRECLSRSETTQRLEEDLDRRSTWLAQREQEFAERESEWSRRRDDSESAWEELLGQLNAQLRDVSERRQQLQEEHERLRERERSLELQASHREKGQPAPSEPRPPKTDHVAQPTQVAQPTSAFVTPTGSLDWEGLKRQLISQMEQDARTDAADPQEAAAAQREHFDIQEILRKTDAILADKDRQIQELEALLHGQSANLGDMAVGAAAIAQFIDEDALIQQERDDLRRLQEEWHDKLRKAELEISIERAKIARERVALDEKIRQLEKEAASQQAAPVVKDPSGSPQKGKWLARLGLLDQTGGQK